MNLLEERGPDNGEDNFPKFSFGMIPPERGFSEATGERVNEVDSYEEQSGIIWRVFNEVARWEREFGVTAKSGSVGAEARQMILEDPLAHQSLVFGGIDVEVLESYIRKALLLSQRGNAWVSEDDLRVFLEGEESRQAPANDALF